MGNGATKLTHCLCLCSSCASASSSSVPLRRRRRRLRLRHVAPSALLPSDPFDDSLGHSFCYVRSSSSSSSSCPPAPTTSSSDPPTFRCISGAAVSANASTPLSTSLLLPHYSAVSAASSFESSLSFASIPLQPAPRFPSGPLSGPLPSDRPFLSGPLDRPAAFLSGPLPLDPASTSSPPSTLRRTRSVLPGRRRHHRRRRHVSALLRSLASSLPFAKDKALPDEPLGSGPKDSPMNSSGSSVEWAQGKAGEDRVHVVVSEEHGWVFVGIYDGFNGPDATDFLLTHLYPSIHLQLKGILWQDADSEETQKRPGGRPKNGGGKARHVEVLKALSRALRKTEEAYLSIADNMLEENPELALMGSCVLVMLMKGQDVYLMNVGDSRAVLATKSRRDLEGINEDLLNDFAGFLPSLSAVQLTFDHSTCTKEVSTVCASLFNFYFSTLSSQMVFFFPLS